MKGVFAAALEIQEFLHRAGAKFCFIGGVALREAPEVLERLRRLRQA